MKKRLLCALLTLCMVITLLPTTAFAATSYNTGNALAYAASHWNDGKGLCAEFVSDCIKAGGLTSWDTECTNLYNKLNYEVVSGARIASIQYLTTSGNYIKTADNVGKIAKGDVLFWLCSGCPHDSVGGPYQHTALVSDISGTYVKVYQHNSARNNVNAWVGNCYECGRRYSHMVVVHFGNSNSSAVTVQSYFDCDVQIKTTAGKSVGLYSNPTDTVQKTAFTQGQTACSTKGAKLTNGEIFYEVKAIHQGQVITVWLNAGANGVTIINNGPTYSMSLSTDSITLSPGEKQTISIQYNWTKTPPYRIDYQFHSDTTAIGAWGAQSSSNSGGTVQLNVTAQNAGTTTLDIWLTDSNGNELCKKTVTVCVKGLEFFDCNVRINTTRGQRVNLFADPTSSSPTTYFAQGQTAYSTRGVRFNGETWYQIQAIHQGTISNFWLNEKSSGVSISNIG